MKTNFAKKSGNIMSVFTQTMDKLSKLNELIKAEFEENHSKMIDLGIRNCDLEKMEAKNAKVIDNISKIVE